MTLVAFLFRLFKRDVNKLFDIYILLFFITFSPIGFFYALFKKSVIARIKFLSVLLCNFFMAFFWKKKYFGTKLIFFLNVAPHDNNSVLFSVKESLEKFMILVEDKTAGADWSSFVCKYAFYAGCGVAVAGGVLFIMRIAPIINPEDFVGFSTDHQICACFMGFFAGFCNAKINLDSKTPSGGGGGSNPSQKQLIVEKEFTADCNNFKPSGASEQKIIVNDILEVDFNLFYFENFYFVGFVYLALAFIFFSFFLLRWFLIILSVIENFLFIVKINCFRVASFFTKIIFNCLFLLLDKLPTDLMVSFNLWLKISQFFNSLRASKVDMGGFVVVNEFTYYLIWGFGAAAFFIVSILWTEWNNVTNPTSVRFKIKYSFISVLGGIVAGRWKLKDYVTRETKIEKWVESFEKTNAAGVKDFIENDYSKILNKINKSSSDFKGFTADTNSNNKDISSPSISSHGNYNINEIIDSIDFSYVFLCLLFVLLIYASIKLVIEPIFPNFNLKFLLTAFLKKIGVEKNKREEWKLSLVLFSLYVQSYIIYFYYAEVFDYYKFVIFFFAYLSYIGFLLLFFKFISVVYIFTQKNKNV